MSDGDVRSVGRALGLLLAFNDQRLEITLTELSHELHLSMSTTHRLLNTLKSYRFVEQDEATGKYRLGLALIRLGAAAQIGTTLMRHSGLPLRELAIQTAETAYLCVLDGIAALCVAREESRNPVRVLSLEVGGHIALNCGGAPRVLLASLSDTEIERLLEDGDFEPMTPKTPAEPEDVWRDVHLTRTTGYCVASDDFIEGIAAVGAPIRDHTLKVVASISVAGLSPHFVEDRLPPIITAVRQAAESISKSMGWVRPASTY